jgi:sporulation protein YlmC with PRC-barrel domain
MKRTLTQTIEIAIGADVTGIGGKLGVISRVIVEDGEITAVVVRHGLINVMEYVVPLAAIDRDAEGQLGLPLTEQQLQECEPFDVSAYRLPDEEYVPPPSLSGYGLEPYAGTGFIALGPRAFTASGQMVLGEAWEPPQALRQVPWSSISRGTEVVDRRGDKVGEVAELALNSASGDASRVVVQSGFLRHRRRDLPLPWVEALEDERVVLRVAREEVEALPTT